MKLQFTDIRELRAHLLTEPVTLVSCDIPDAFGGNQAKEVNDFNSGEHWLTNTTISCYRNPDESTIDAFHQVDEMMERYAGGVRELIIIHPLQELMQDPYDDEELQALYDIAIGWAKDTGCKIVLVLDTSNSFPYYPKKLY